jgi:hypothetical protein
MSKSDLVTPILIEIHNILYKLIYINFAEDGSIYVFFPRKKGYAITKGKGVPVKITTGQMISLERFPDKLVAPYVSYHPKSRSVHINTVDGEIYRRDAKVLSLAEDENILAFPLCQILFMSFSYLEVYSSKKYLFPYILKSKTPNPESNLSLEIFIQPVGTYSNWEDLPADKARRATSNPVGLVRFDSKKLKSHTCTIAITESKTKMKIEEGVTPGVVVIVADEKEQYIFELIPNT